MPKHCLTVCILLIKPPISTTPAQPTHTTPVIINEFHHLTSITHCANSNKSLRQTQKQIFVGGSDFPKQTNKITIIIIINNNKNSRPTKEYVCLSVRASTFARHRTAVTRAMNTLTASLHLM